MPPAPNPAVELLNQRHDRSQFDCGNDSLNHYLKTQSTQDIRRYLSQTYVMALGDQTVIGFYTLSASLIEYAHLPDEARRKLSRYPIPAALIGRLAVDKRHQRRGLARTLLGDALRRSVELSKVLGIHAVVVDAKDATVAQFYVTFGFLCLTDSPLHLFLSIKTIEAATP